VPPLDDINAEQFHRYFDDKVVSVRAATTDAQLPSFASTTSLHTSIRQSQPVTADEVITAVRALPDKSCALDLLPTVHLKAIADVITPFLTELFNRSLVEWRRSGSF